MVSDGPVTVSVAWLLFAVVVPSVAVAVMCAVPGLCPLTMAVAMPVLGLVEVESTVATVVLSDANVIVTPVIARPYWSKAWAVNCVVSPTLMLAVGGEIVTVVGWPGQFPKGVPSTFRP